MSFKILSFIACVGCLLIGFSAQAISIAAHSEQPQYVQVSKELSLNQLRSQAQAITVKVLAGKGWGSGILIKKQGQIYTVLTNAHVLRLGKNYQIQTFDGRLYNAVENQAVQFQSNDLTILNFRSSANYAVTTLAKEPLEIGTETFASGFPADGQNFAFTTGKVEYLLPQALEGGYQIGYTNEIVKGMSGGPVLNRRGELIAINGKHKHPLWGNTYVFKDGSTPVLKVRQQFDYSSWAVPVQTFLQQVPQFASTTDVQTNMDAETIRAIPENTTIEKRPGSFW
jgi:S1-C subfamily serine protease